MFYSFTILARAITVYFLDTHWSTTGHLDVAITGSVEEPITNKIFLFKLMTNCCYGELIYKINEIKSVQDLAISERLIHSESAQKRVEISADTDMDQHRARRTDRAALTGHRKVRLGAD
jgi:hypothetical protein